MKYFGEYLISKNIITDEQLVIALIEQMKLSAPIPVIANNLHIFTNQEFLQIFKYQTEKGSEFIQACKDLNLWTADKQNKIYQQLSKNRPPIGQVIVNLGFAKLEVLTKSLDEFLSRIEKPEAPVKPETPVKTEMTAPVANQNLNQNTNESKSVSENKNKSNIKMDPSFVEELKQQMKDLQKQEILDLLQAFLNTKDDSAVMEIITIIHTFKSTAKLAGADQLSNFLNQIEKAVLHLKNKTDNPNWTAGVALVTQAIESSFYIKNNVLKAMNEDILSSDPVLNSLVKKTTQDLDTIFKI